MTWQGVLFLAVFTLSAGFILGELEKQIYRLYKEEKENGKQQNNDCL